MSVIAPFLRLLYRKPPSFLEDNRFKTIDSMILQAKYEEAKEILNGYKRSEDLLYSLDIENDALVTLYNAKISVESGKIDQTSKDLDWMQMHIVRIENDLIASAMLHVIGSIQEAMGEINESLETINDGLVRVENLKKFYPLSYDLLKAHLLTIKGKILRKKVEIDKGIQILNQAIEIYSKHNLHFYTAEPLNTMGVSYVMIGKSELALQTLDKSRVIYEELGNGLKILKIHNNQGMINWQHGNPDNALKDFFRALEISNEFELITYGAMIQINIGLILMDKGQLREAKDYFERSLNFFIDQGNELSMALCYNNLGSLYSNIGDFKKTNEYLSSALEIYENLGIQDKIAMMYSNIALSNFVSGDYALATKLLQKSIRMYQKIGNPREVIRPLKALNDVYLATNQMEKASEIIQQMQQIVKEAPDNKVTQLHKLAKAQYLMNSDRVIQHAEAQKLLAEIADEDVIEQSQTTEAMLALASLLIRELKASPSDEALDEFKELIYRLEAVVRQDETLISKPDLIQVLILKSKLALIDLNLDEGQSLMDEAYELAKSIDFVQITEVIEEERNKFDEEMLKYKKLVDTNASLYERLQQTNIENYLVKAEIILKR